MSEISIRLNVLCLTKSKYLLFNEKPFRAHGTAAVARSLWTNAMRPPLCLEQGNADVEYAADQ
jgi:hypothetical protein